MQGCVLILLICMWLCNLPSHHLLKRLSFLHCIFLPPLSKVNWLWMCGFISGSILFHWSMCLFLCQCHAIWLLYLCSIFWNLGELCLLLCAFFLRITLAILGLLLTKSQYFFCWLKKYLQPKSWDLCFIQWKFGGLQAWETASQVTLRELLWGGRAGCGRNQVILKFATKGRQSEHQKYFCELKRRGRRGRDGQMASLSQWTWVWASSGRWWRTGKPGVLEAWS